MAIVLYPRQAGTRGSPAPPLGSTIARGHPLAQGLVVLYLLNEGGGGPFESAFGQGQATLSGATWGSGLLGPGISFAGSTNKFSDTTVGGGLAIADSSNFTIEVLLTMTAAPSLAHIFGVVDDPNVDHFGPARSFLAFPGTPGNIYFWGGHADLDSGVAWKTDGSVQHVFCTRNGTSMVFYRDGVQIASGTTPSLTSTGNQVFAGSYHPSGTATWSGILHKAAVYNRALTAAEVGQLTAEPWAFIRPAGAGRVRATSEALGSATKFRKTASPIGTRAGSRQLFGN